MSENINGYELTCEWNVSGTAQWAYAKKDGKQWFIKRFLAPKYKIAGKGISREEVDKAYNRCEAFRAKQEAYYERIACADSGNIIYVTDFFSYSTFFYAVSPRIEIADVPMAEVAKLPHRKKMVLLKVLTHSLENLHKNGVVHADLKPSNIILKKTQTGGYTLKLIDFEAGFLREDPRRGNNIVFDQNYVAPETLIAMDNPEIDLDDKIDVFALGLLFYQYYTGEDPVLPEEGNWPAVVLLNKEEIKLEAALPGWLRELIQQMIQLERDDRPATKEVFECLKEERAPKNYVLPINSVSPEKKPDPEIWFHPVKL